MAKIRLSLLLFFITGTLFAQDIPASTPIILGGSHNDLNVVAVSPLKFKRMAVAGWDNEVLVYQTDSPYKLVQKLSGHTAQINALTYNFSGNMLASGGMDLSMRVYDSMYRFVPFAEDLNNRHLAAITSIIFDKSGKFIFSGDKEGKLMLWDVVNKKPIKFYSTGNTINDLCLSPQAANIFVAQSDKQIKLIALAGGKILRTMDGHTDAVNVLALSNNNQYLLSGSNDKTARLWDLKTWKPSFVLPVESWKVTAVAFTDDSKYCVTACNDGAIKVWEVETGKLVGKTSYPEVNIRDIAFSKNNQLLIIAPKLKEGSEYGARIVPSMLPMPVLIEPTLKIISPAQKSLDSIMSIRPLTKQDSIKFKNILIQKSTNKSGTKGNENKNLPGSNNPIDSAVIYKTPMNYIPKKK